MLFSGESPSIPIVPLGKPPKTIKEKLKVLEIMDSHAQYCPTGDSTVEATAKAV